MKNIPQCEIFLAVSKKTNELKMIRTQAMLFNIWVILEGFFMSRISFSIQSNLPSDPPVGLHIYPKMLFYFNLKDSFIPLGLS
jgi:hypothetical protein